MSDKDTTPSGPPDPPEGQFFYGNGEKDITPWLFEWVRVELAEHHSTIYDTIPRGAIPVIVSIVLAGMAAAENSTQNPGDENAQGTGTGA